ncbi:TolC family protein [Primorskyibacter sp. S187A]|uniref:TolC family protein n=1 Tax=Primorskyibacter sp. S187A TaxID=3415130 RepID=UPI003C7EA5BB
MRWRTISKAGLAVSCVALAGCLPTGDGSEGAGASVSRFLQNPGQVLSNDAAAQAALSETERATQRPDGTASPIIEDLAERRSILPKGSSYDKVARAVLTSSSRIAEAELRGAHLRAQAAKYNWLPQLGPSISLSSLGDFVTSLVVEQVLFDNGRKRAERDYARFDVEKAAVTLSQDSNDRVHDALSLFLAAEEGRARSAISERSLSDMGHFEWIMNERVKGGISDMSDLNVIRQKLAEIRAQQSSAQAAIRTAEAELAAMAGAPVSGISGVPDFRVTGGGRVPLSVLLAETERDLAVAQATVARAQHLPGLSARGTLTANNSSGAITAGGDTFFGIGTGASLKAIDAERDAATRRVAQAREDANRKIAALDQQMAGLGAQLMQARTLATQAKANLDLFQSQYKGGARQVMDVVGVYETWARQSESVVTKTFELERLRIDKARALGILADGGLI